MATRRIEPEGYQDYTRNEQKHSYSHDTGVIVMPVASRTAAHRLIRLHGGIGLRTTTFTMERSGKPPIIPSAADTSGDTLIGSVLIPSLPVPNVNGDSYDWSVSGVYSYVQDTIRIPGTDHFPVGQYPYPIPKAEAKATEIASEYLSYYTGADPFQTFITQVQDNARLHAPFEWPILALPAVLSSDHILQD